MSTQTPREFRASTIDRNRPAFELWQRTCRLLETSIASPRSHQGQADLACDLLFLQIYKSSCSVYLLAVRGQEEDAFTILRRILELGVQLEYLQRAAPGEENARAARYLAQDPDVGRHYWWGGSFADLFRELGVEQTYQDDYRFLAQIAHGAARRILLPLCDGQLQIRTTEFFTTLLVFAAMYALGAAKTWNSRFHPMPEAELEALAEESLGFRKRLLEQHARSATPRPDGLARHGPCRRKARAVPRGPRVTPGVGRTRPVRRSQRR